MTYQDFEEIPRIQRLEEQFRDQNIRFEGYLNFAISKAIQTAGTEDDQDEITSLAVAILEAELQRRVVEKEDQGRRRPQGLLRFLRNLRARH